MAVLDTRYMGLDLKNPLVISASPFSKRIDLLQNLEQAGAAAVVMHSLFEEQVTSQLYQLDPQLTRRSLAVSEAFDYYPYLGYYNLDPEEHLQHLYQVKQKLSIPVIASLNGISEGGWTEYAHNLEQAGADALELNLYYLPTEPNLSGNELEETYLNLVRKVRSRIRIPLAVKLHPFFTSLPNIATRFGEAGANGLVLFNRFYQPDLDLDNLKVSTELQLSTSYDLRIPLRWIAVLSGRVKPDLALTGGVHNGQDALKAIAAGASVVEMVSELISNGIGRLKEILTEIEVWLHEHSYQSISQLRGVLSAQNVAEPAAFERANYMKILNMYDDLLEK